MPRKRPRKVTIDPELADAVAVHRVDEFGKAEPLCRRVLTNLTLARGRQQANAHCAWTDILPGCFATFYGVAQGVRGSPAGAAKTGAG